jgi:hypothetical protein
VLTRRNVLTGLGATLLIAPAITLADDPLICGIRWQIWPFDTARPNEWASGSISICPHETVKPTSYFLKSLAKHETPVFGKLYWEPLE